jgi:hypothetical protein
MNQSARDVEAEAQKPQHQDDYKNCPKHDLLLCLTNSGHNPA